jgi:aminopeptidase YwaD
MPMFQTPSVAQTAPARGRSKRLVATTGDRARGVAVVPVVLAGLVVFVAGAGASPLASPFGGAARASVPAISADDARADVRYLASPELEGRGALTAGLARAGGYVAGRFAAAGLSPGGDGGTFFQAVDIPLARRPGPGTRLVLAGQAMTLGEDFSPNLSAAATRAVGPIVFAGYGVVIPGRYDDFAGIDVRGKLIICLRYAPGFDERDGPPADPALREAAALRLKVENALGRGAIGIAIVDPPRAGTEASAAPLSFIAEHGASGIATFHVRAPAIDRLLAGSGRTVASLRAQIETQGKPASFELPGLADFAVEWTAPVARGRNVMAVLEGADPALRGEAVLVGAHYDHLGRGDEGSALDGRSVHPGGDDNASGTAALLEIAESFAREAARPRRSIIFAAFTGEEKGLLGSAAAAAQPGKRVVAMLNLDMVGRLRNDALEVGGTTTAPEWPGIVAAANTERLALAFPRRVVPNSDHASFLSRQVPALFLFTGMHEDYHRATDTWDKVNVDGLAKVARLAARVARLVADRPQTLAFAAPEWTRSASLGAAHGTAVRLGIVPDYGPGSQGGNAGLRVSDVLPGGPAALAGLTPGDVIESIGGKDVADIEGYMEALAPFKPGEEAPLRVRRGGTTREVKVRFAGPDEARPGGRP